MRAGHQADLERGKCGRYMRFVKNLGSTSTDVDVGLAAIRLIESRSSRNGFAEKKEGNEKIGNDRNARTRVISNLWYNRRDSAREIVNRIPHCSSSWTRTHFVIDFMFRYGVPYLEMLAAGRLMLSLHWKKRTTYLIIGSDAMNIEKNLSKKISKKFCFNISTADVK